MRNEMFGVIIGIILFMFAIILGGIYDDAEFKPQNDTPLTWHIPEPTCADMKEFCK